MDELLNEYIQCEKEQKLHADNSNDGNNNDVDQNTEYDDYVERTKEYYNKMSVRDFFSALWFTM